MPDWVFHTMTACAAAASVYAAIRADLAALHVKADTAAQAADKAHERIDHLFNSRRD